MGCRYDYVGQAMSVTARAKNVLQHAFTRSHVEVADGLELAEADDDEGLLSLVDWVGFDEDEGI